MNQLISKNKKWMGYTIYCLILTAVFLYFLFPSEAIKACIQAKAQRIHPGIQVTSQRLSLSFPTGLKLFQTAVSLEEDPGHLLFKADRISLRPGIWPVLKDSAEYYFDCRAYGGHLRGRIITKDYPVTSFNASIEFEDVGIGQDSPVVSIIGDRLEGTFSGYIDYQGEPDTSIARGSGEALLTISDCLVKLAEPVLTLETIDFDEIQVKMSLKRQQISISSAELKGDKMIGTFSGNINMDKDFMESRLDLQGKVEPTAKLFKDMPGSGRAINLIKEGINDGKLPFTLKGTIKNPKMSFI
jgi:type II secretion system protein N